MSMKLSGLMTPFSLPKEILATANNVAKYIAEKQPELKEIFTNRSPATLATGAVSAAAFITFIVSLFNKSRKARWGGFLTWLGAGVVDLLVQWKSGVLRGTLGRMGLFRDSIPAEYERENGAPSTETPEPAKDS